MKLKQIKTLFGFILPLVLVTLVSCGGGAAAPPVDNAELERNRRLWRESGITSYRMTVDLQKTGHANPMGQFVIEVREGKTVSVKSARDPSRAVEFERMSWYDSVEDIFGIVESAAGGQPEKLFVEYESKLGYPQTLHLDYKSSVMDDELFFKVLQFEILQ